MPTSSFRGVSWSAREKKWHVKVSIGKKGQQSYVGAFDSEVAAARAYDEHAKKLHKEPILNFLPNEALNPERKNMGLRPTIKGGKSEGGAGGKGKDSKGTSRKQQQQEDEDEEDDEEETAAEEEEEETDEEQEQQPVSGFRDVYPLGTDWVARMSPGGVDIYLGIFDTREKAARAVDQEARRRWLSPVLNFLPDGAVNPGRFAPQSAVPRRKEPKKQPAQQPQQLKSKKEKKKEKKKKKGQDVAGRAGVGPGGGRNSMYRCVQPNGRGGWKARISVKGAKQFIGPFDSEEAAARAFDREAKAQFSDPILNFLPDGSLNPDRFAHVGRRGFTLKKKRKRGSSSSSEVVAGSSDWSSSSDSGSDSSSGSGSDGVIDSDSSWEEDSEEEKEESGSDDDDDDDDENSTDEDGEGSVAGLAGLAPLAKLLGVAKPPPGLQRAYDALLSALHAIGRDSTPSGPVAPIPTDYNWSPLPPPPAWPPNAAAALQAYAVSRFVGQEERDEETRTALRALATGEGRAAASFLRSVAGIRLPPDGHDAAKAKARLVRKFVKLSRGDPGAQGGGKKKKR